MVQLRVPLTILKSCANVFAIALLAVSPISDSNTEWIAPRGIPEPEFGIHQSHGMYAGVAGYSNAGNGPFTHYVDNSATCTDADNEFGSRERPRCTLPTVFPAGSVVEVHGGPYVARRDWRWRLNGTAAKPVFIRGVASANRPVFFDGRIFISGSYAIAENLDIRQTIVFFEAPAQHLALRNSHVHDHIGAGALVLNRGGKHIVIYNNEIDHNGKIPSKKDRHGVFTGRDTNHVWIVDNHIHHNSGDAIQFCHGCVREGNGPANVYIGRNYMHDDEENAIDVKEFIGPVIVSENVISNYRRSPGSNGDAIRVNDEGLQGEIWIMYNRISNSTFGIQSSDSKAEVFVVSNVISDIDRAAIGRDADYVLNNTIRDVGDGIRGGVAQNNIVTGARSIAIGDGVVRCLNNLVSGGRINGRCGATVSSDPQFVLDTEGKLVGIAEDSPAAGAGAAPADHPVYQWFEERYGMSIRTDENGRSRPEGEQWSIGAHEPVEGIKSALVSQ